MLPTAFFLLLSLFAIQRLAGPRSWLWAVIAGAAAGFAVMLREPSVACLLPLGAYLIAVSWKHGARTVALRLLSWALPLTAALGAIGLYDWMRFGDIWETGYGLHGDTAAFSLNVLPGLAGLLFSPGKSVFLFSPALLAAVAALPGFWRAHRALVIAVLGLALVNLLLYASYRDWSGDWAWGPRYMVTITPILMLPAVSLIARWRSLARVWQGTVVAVAFGGVLVNLLDISIDWYHQLALLEQERIPFDYWSPFMSAIWRHGDALISMLQGQAVYPYRFTGLDLFYGRPPTITWDVWWNYAWLGHGRFWVVAGVATALLALLLVLARLVQAARVLENGGRSGGRVMTPAPVSS